MKVALDTSAIIYLNDFRKFQEMFTVAEVLEEVKDEISSLKLSGINLKIIEPSTIFVEEVKQTAKVIGDLEKLSNTDLKLLALAKEKSLTLISDDRSVQNVAEKIGVRYLSVFSKKIAKFILWRKFCTSCKKYFEKDDVCSVCGSRLRRVPIKSEYLS